MRIKSLFYELKVTFKQSLWLEATILDSGAGDVLSSPFLLHIHNFIYLILIYVYGITHYNAGPKKMIFYMYIKYIYTYMCILYIIYTLYLHNI